MKITIPKQSGNSITEEIKFELGKYTIFAGENNAGKTNLMKALMGLSLLPEEQIIYIPAESIRANEQLKTTAAEDPLRKAFLKLIEVTVGKLPSVNYETIEDFLKRISDTFDSFAVRNIKLELGVSELTEENVEKIVRDEVSKKILDSVVKDNYGKTSDVKIEDVGQGTQRLIIAAILQELSRADSKSKDLFLIFEEPEIYLHPKLKKSLHKSLLKISEENNVRVILTTHDPYFIELGADQKIYNVFRDKDGATRVDLPPAGVLEVPTTAEINYVIFEVPSTDYLLQLHQAAEEKDGVEGFKDHEIDGISIFDIRGALAHKTSKTGRKEQPGITEDTKKGAIDYLRSVLEEEQTEETEIGDTQTDDGEGSSPEASDAESD